MLSDTEIELAELEGEMLAIVCKWDKQASTVHLQPVREAYLARKWEEMQPVQRRWLEVSGYFERVVL